MRSHRSSLPPNAADADAREAWDDLIQFSELISHKFPPFDSWSELQEARAEAGLDKDPDSLLAEAPLRVAIAASCLSVFQIFVVACSIFTFRRVTRSKDSPDRKLQASFTLLSGISTDIGAIELLIRNGFDLQARSIIRSLREKMDALVAVQLDRAFAVAFVAADSSDEINSFWHQRVSRGKLIKNIKRRLAHYAAEGESPIDRHWLSERRNFDRWLGEAVHPSHAAGLLAAFPSLSEDDRQSEGGGFFGLPSEIGVTNARCVLELAHELIFIVQARNLCPMTWDESNLQLEEGDLSIYDICKASEKFLIACIANSWFGPNIDLYKAKMYLRGYAFAPIDGELDSSTYRREIIDIFIGILNGVKSKIDQRLQDVSGAPEK